MTTPAARKYLESDRFDWKEAIKDLEDSDEVTEEFIKEYARERARELGRAYFDKKNMKGNREAYARKFDNAIEGLDVNDYVNVNRLKSIVGRKVSFEEKREARLTDLRNIGTAEGLREYGLSPSRATYKTLMGRFDVSEEIAREEAERLGL